jgi:hypothetical protein
MSAISNRLPPIDVEYDAAGVRRVKHFEDAYEARRFFMAKDKEGKNPAVRRPQREDSEMTKTTKAASRSAKSKPTKKVSGSAEPTTPATDHRPVGVKGS